MTLQITLPVELEQRLQQEAIRQGLATNTYVLQLLERHLPPALSRMDAARMLEQWAAEAESMSAEEAEANANVLRGIDDVRLSERKLFPGL